MLGVNYLLLLEAGVEMHEDIAISVDQVQFPVAFRHSVHDNLLMSLEGSPWEASLPWEDIEPSTPLDILQGYVALDLKEFNQVGGLGRVVFEVEDVLSIYTNIIMIVESTKNIFFRLKTGSLPNSCLKSVSRLDDLILDRLLIMPSSLKSLFFIQEVIITP